MAEKSFMSAETIERPLSTINVPSPSIILLGTGTIFKPVSHIPEKAFPNIRAKINANLIFIIIAVVL